MVAHRADGRGLLTNLNVTAVAALPDFITIAGEHKAALNVGQQLAVALLVVLLHSGHTVKQHSQLLKALFTGFLGEGVVHVRPFVILAFCSILQVLHGAGDTTIMQSLEPELGVLLLVTGCLFEKFRNLHIAILLGLGGIVLILSVSLGLASKGNSQILSGLCSFQIHNRLILS